MTDPFGLGPDELTLREEARSLVAGVTAGEEHRWETDGSFPRERLAGLGDAGLLGLTHPPDLGGRGAGRLEAVIVLEEIAQASFALAEAVQIAVNGPAYVLSVFGTERLRRSYVPPVIAGRSLISIAITEEGAGSALGETATRVTDKGDVVVVDGTKCFVTGGGLASAHLVMARFGGEGMRGLGYVLVPADAEGCRVACTYEKIGGNAVPEAVVELRGCAVPADHVIAPGDPGSTGGFRRAMTTYNAMRLGIAAICCGVATRALSLAVRHVRSRPTRACAGAPPRSRPTSKPHGCSPTVPPT